VEMKANPKGQTSSTNKSMNIVIILTAGVSKRMKGLDKIFCRIKNKPLIFYTISVFESHPQVGKIILVSRKNNFKRLHLLIKKYKFRKVVAITQGGKERQESASYGLNAAKSAGARQGDLILFHNGANPLISNKEIEEVIGAAKKYKAALVGQFARDTIKKISKNYFVIKTIDRKKIFLAQTPQVIEYSLAKKAFEKAMTENFRGTDDVSLVERLGKKVKIVPCSYKNIKVTTRDDLKTIIAFVKNR
jgi:2-C-methyl-D-erythritol 4-phosphate cytidylyltransferase